MLAARGLEHWYEPGRAVLRGIDVDAPRGAVTVVLGPNGAGKSTLLRILAGVARSRAGRVEVSGAPLGAMSARQRAHVVAYIPQQSSIAFPFTLSEYVRLGAWAVRHGSEATAWAIREVGLWDRRDDPVGALSAGQRQRATFARALAQCRGMGQGGVLVADEPTSAMDPRHALEAMDLLKGCAARGFAVVAAVHDLTLAMRYADRALLLGEAGEVAARGPAGEVLKPDVLSGVFGVRFAWAEGEGGVRALVPHRLG